MESPFNQIIIIVFFLSFRKKCGLCLRRRNQIPPINFKLWPLIYYVCVIHAWEVKRLKHFSIYYNNSRLIKLLFYGLENYKPFPWKQLTKRQKLYTFTHLFCLCHFLLKETPSDDLWRYANTFLNLTAKITLILTSEYQNLCWINRQHNLDCLHFYFIRLKWRNKILET